MTRYINTVIVFCRKRILEPILMLRNKNSISTESSFWRRNTVCDAFGARKANSKLNEIYTKKTFENILNVL